MDRINRKIVICLFVSLLVANVYGFGIAAEVTAKSRGYVLDIIGVPQDITAGQYDLKTGLFTIDVSHIDNAHVRISSEDLIITGLVVNWDGDGYLTVTKDARVKQEQMTLVGDKIEYFSDTEQMFGEGNIKATTDDAIIYSDRVVYMQEENRAEFFGNVVVEVSDGKLYAEHLIIWTELEQMEFVGSFKGEFSR